MQTSCSNCVFAIYHNQAQSGCEFDRIKKFKNSAKKSRDNEKKFYIIDRVCNYYRNKDSEYSVLDKNLVQEESAVSFDIIFNYSKLSQEESDRIVSFINDGTYCKNKLNIMLLHEYDDDIKVKEHIIKISSESKRNITVTLCHPVDEFLNGHIIKSKSDYHILINKNIENADQSFLTNINNVINEDLKQCVVFSNGSYTAIHNLSYKLYSKFNPGLKYVDYTNYLIEEAKKSNFYTEF